MKIKVDQEFDYPLATLLRAREERYKHLDKFPELKNVSIVEEERNGDILKQVRHISIAESMPAALSAVMPPDAAKLIESSEFKESENLHTFEVKPGGGLDIFMITGVSRYYELDGDRSGRNYEIEIKSKVFLAGPMIEGAIADVYKKNLEKDKASIAHFIQILKEEGGSDDAPATDADATAGSSPAS